MRSFEAQPSQSKCNPINLDDGFELDALIDSQQPDPSIQQQGHRLRTTTRSQRLLSQCTPLPNRHQAAMAAPAASAATTLLYDQLLDLGDPLPPGVPGDEAGFCALVESAGGAASVLEGDSSSGGGPLSGLARALVGCVRAAEAGGDGDVAAMEEEEEEEEVGFVGLGGWVDWLIDGSTRVGCGGRVGCGCVGCPLISCPHARTAHHAHFYLTTIECPGLPGRARVPVSGGKRSRRACLPGDGAAGQSRLR